MAKPRKKLRPSHAPLVAARHQRRADLKEGVFKKSPKNRRSLSARPSTAAAQVGSIPLGHVDADLLHQPRRQGPVEEPQGTLEKAKDELRASTA